MVSVPVPFLVSEGLVKASRFRIVPARTACERVTSLVSSSMESMRVPAGILVPVTLMPGVSWAISETVKPVRRVVPLAVTEAGTDDLSAMRGRGESVAPGCRT